MATKVKKGWEDKIYYGLLDGATVKRKLRDFSEKELQSILDASDNANEYIDGEKSKNAGKVDNRPGEPAPKPPAPPASRAGHAEP